MSFPLGSLLGGKDADAAPAASNKVYKRQAKKAASEPPPRGNPLRTPLWLIIGGLLWCLVALAMVTHDPADASFSISGSRALYGNRVGAVGAWISDLLLFGFGYSSWWLLLIGLRLWLGSLAGLLRNGGPEPTPGWRRTAPWIGGVLLFLCASCALEWTRLYLGEARLPGHAGGVLGYTLGPWSMRALGFAGSGVVWIAALLAGASLALQFSWLRLAELL